MNGLISHLPESEVAVAWLDLFSPTTGGGGGGGGAPPRPCPPMYKIYTYCTHIC